MRKLLCLGLGMVLASVPALAAKPKAAPVSEATIINTGSTNTSGYEVFVQTSGRVRYAATRRSSTGQITMQQGQIAKAQAASLFRDLAAAIPLAKLPVTHTFKSVSFGTSAYIVYKGQRTPDLSFPADGRGKALQADITRLAASLHLTNTLRGSFGSPVELMPAPKP